MTARRGVHPLRTVSHQRLSRARVPQRRAARPRVNPRNIGVVELAEALHTGPSMDIFIVAVAVLVVAVLPALRPVLVRQRSRRRAMR